MYRTVGYRTVLYVCTVRYRYSVRYGTVPYSTNRSTYRYGTLPYDTGTVPYRFRTGKVLSVRYRTTLPYGMNSWHFASKLVSENDIRLGWVVGRWVIANRLRVK